MFSVSPASCAGEDWLLLLVSSAPGETNLRSDWRHQVEVEAEAGRGVKVRLSDLSLLSSDYNYNLLSV